MFFYRFCSFFIGFSRSLSPLCFFGFFLGLFHPSENFLSIFSFPFSAFEFSRLFFCSPLVPFFLLKLFPPFILSGLFLFCPPLSPRRRRFPPLILRPFPGCVFVRSSPRPSPEPFFAFFARFSPSSASPPSHHPYPIVSAFPLSSHTCLSLFRPSFHTCPFSVLFSSVRPPDAPPAFFPSPPLPFFPLPFSPFLSISLVPSPF